MAALEFAALSMPILILTFGALAFGLLLQLQTRLEQSASEAARAASVADVGAVHADVARAALNDALSAIGKGSKSCGSPEITCTFTEAPCPNGSTATDPDCLTVVVRYNNDLAPVFPKLPLLDRFMPSTLSAAATVELNNL